MNDLQAETLMGQAEAVTWKRQVGAAANELRRLLYEGYRRQAWKPLGYANWSGCVRQLAQEYQIGERHMWKIHAANEVEKLLPHGAVGQIPERHLRPLTKLNTDDEKREIWETAVSTAPNGNMTARHVENVVENHILGGGYPIADSDYTIKPYPTTAANHTKSDTPGYDGDEWYTPEEIVDYARRVMGSIDLDPATCAEAQRMHKIANWFDKYDDGLKKMWYGNVWLNPPYSAQLITSFTDKLLSEYEAGNVLQAVLLVNNSSETAWFQKLLEHYPACFKRARVQFWREDHDTFGARQGQVFFYLGKNVDLFRNVFAEIGIVVSNDNK